MNKRIHAFYLGDVQGVGFRFTAVRIASVLRIKGWVKNLSDGRVEIIAEGEEGKLLEFLRKIKMGALHYYIHDVDVSWQEFKDEFEKFNMKF